MKTALCVQRDLPGFKRTAHLFLVDPAIEFEAVDFDWETRIESREKKTTNYIVVSGINSAWTGPETYIFPSDENGKILDWAELDGSFQGGIDHHRALVNAGYSVKGFLS